MTIATPRTILAGLLLSHSDLIGRYTFRDGSSGPAVGILGLRDQRVQTTEGVEILISLVPEGDYEYGASRHISHNAHYTIKLIQHQAPTLNLPALVPAAVSMGHFGKVEYHEPSGASESVPYALVEVGIANWAWTDIEAYQQNCSWGCGVIIGVDSSD